jgi:hypothetical protein
MDTITTIQSLLMCNGSARPVTVELTPNTEALIAASPTLLEALEGIVAINPAELQENDQLALIHAFLLARQKAIAAITLATGEPK